MEEGLFPHRMSSDEPGRIEEERRLCYVGITRAMKKLVLTYAETRRLHGNDSYNRPSRFVQEIPPGVLEEVRLGGSVSRPMAQPSGGGRFLESTAPGLRLGQRVRHATFGEGVVLQSEGSGERARVQVNFAAAGAKWLMLGFAKLQQLD
jgi:DNA helicase-2/ATP-dependent DNA helicase PcrA